MFAYGQSTDEYRVKSNFLDEVPKPTTVKAYTARPRPKFTEEPNQMKLAPIRADKPIGNVGFSNMGMLNHEQPRHLNVDELRKYARGAEKSKKRRREDSDTSTEGTSKNKDKYMEWMKNLSLFHQMREKAEEMKAKDKMEDYKMQVMKSLMDKNKILEEMEQKITNMEEGHDPVQQRLLDKIEQLERAVAMKNRGGVDPSAINGKMNQAVEVMMYNMSVLQQMVTNVAQMQRAQAEHAAETNRVLQSLPQLIRHGYFQQPPGNGGYPENIVNQNKSQMMKKKTKGKRKVPKLEDIDITHSVSEIHAKNVNNAGVHTIKKRPNQVTALHNIPTNDRKQTLLSPVDNQPVLSKSRSREINPRSNLITSAKQTQIMDSNRYRAGMVNTPAMMATVHQSENQDDSIIKDDDSSKFNYSNKEDSIRAKEVTQGHKTMIKDESIAYSEGAQEKPSKEYRRISRMKTDGMRGGGDNMLPKSFRDDVEQSRMKRKNQRGGKLDPLDEEQNSKDVIVQVVDNHSVKGSKKSAQRSSKNSQKQNPTPQNKEIEEEEEEGEEENYEPKQPSYKLEKNLTGFSPNQPMGQGRPINSPDFGSIAITPAPNQPSKFANNSSAITANDIKPALN